MSAGIHPDFLKYGKIKPPLNARALPFINFILSKALKATSKNLAENAIIKEEE